jgi:hypothetical protein
MLISRIRDNERRSVRDHLQHAAETQKRQADPRLRAEQRELVHATHTDLEQVLGRRTASELIELLTDQRNRVDACFGEFLASFADGVYE